MRRHPLAAHFGLGDGDGSVIEQAVNVCHTTIVRDAWERGQPLQVHGWVYSLKDGLVRDMNFSVNGADEASTAYESALSGLS